jgi:spermidine synthase
MTSGARERILLANVLVVAVCALVYELLCGTLASYLLGDAVLQFAIVLGTYLSAMGVGAWLSQRLEPRAAPRYVQAEIALALVGGLSVPALLLGVHAHVPLRPALYGTVFVVGVLVGLELPLLVHILRSRKPEEEPRRPRRFGDTLARAFAYDYLGALAASVLFPVVLVPRLGLVRTSVLAGALNAAAAMSALFVLRTERRRVLAAVGLAAIAVLGFAFLRAEAWTSAATD